MNSQKINHLIILNLAGLLIVMAIPLISLTQFYYQNKPSKFDEKHLDSAITVYRYIQPTGYFEDTIFPKTAFNHQRVDSTVRRLYMEKKVIKLLKETLQSLNIIDGTVEEQFVYHYSGKDTLILSVSSDILDYNKLLRASSNDQNFKVYLLPNPKQDNFELVVQNTLIFQYLIKHKPPYLRRTFDLYFTLKNNRLTTEKIITNF